MSMRGRKAWAFTLTLLLVWQTGAFSCHGQSGSEHWTYGTELVQGDHILLGALGLSGTGSVAGAATFPGYDFTLLDTGADGVEGRGLFLFTDPLGIAKTPQQFDKDSADNPDEDSKADGYSLWIESDLYIALNGASQAGSTDTHDAAVEEAQQFYERLHTNQGEWEGLLACSTGESDGEKVSLLSEQEFEVLRDEISPAFWYTDNQETGFWLKSARADYTHQVRYIYSGDIPPSLTTDAYYAYARKTRSVRPALRLNLEEIKFGAGSGTEEDPYRELTLRPKLRGLETEGKPQVGEELRLTVSPAAAECTYQWYRKGKDDALFEPIEGAVGDTFQLGSEDVECWILGEATGAGDYVGKAETTVGPVEKGIQRMPEGDELPSTETVRITDRKIQVVNTTAGLEYALTTAGGLEYPSSAVVGLPCTAGAATGLERTDVEPEYAGGEMNWISSGAFANLSAATNYELYVRRAELPAYYASAMAGPLRVTTKETGEEMTLTLHIDSYNPKNATEVLLIMEPETPEAAAVTHSAVSATAPGIGLAEQTVTIEGITIDAPFSLEIRKAGHLPYIEKGLSLTEDGTREVRLPCGDVNGDGSIDLIDRELLLWIGHYGNTVADTSGRESGTRGQESEAATEGRQQEKLEQPEQLEQLEQQQQRQLQLSDLDGDGRVGWTDLYILMLKDNYGKRVRIQ